MIATKVGKVSMLLVLLAYARVHEKESKGNSLLVYVHVIMARKESIS